MTRFSDLTEFAVTVLDWLLVAAIVLSVISVIVSGYKYIFSLGDEKKLQSATRSLLFSIVGLVLVFLAPSIVQFILIKILGN